MEDPTTTTETAWPCHKNYPHHHHKGKWTCENAEPRAHVHQLGTIDTADAQRGYIYPHQECSHDSYGICGLCVVEFGLEGSFCPVCARGI